MGPELPIGLIGPADIARVFHQAGFTIVGAPAFAEGARRIREKQAESPGFPLVVVDDGTPQLAEWVESQSRRTDVRIIGSDDGPLRSHPLAVPLPITLGDLLDRFQYEVPDGVDVGILIGAGGRTGNNAQPIAVAAPPAPVVQMPAASPVASESFPPPQPRAEQTFAAPESVVNSEPQQSTAAPLASVAQPAHWSFPSPEPVQSSPAPQAPAAGPQPAAVFERRTLPPQPVVSPHQPVTPPLVAPPVQQPLNIHDQRSDFFRQSIQATSAAEVIICWAGKGGVGKTSYTLAIAQTAGEAGLRVLVIDANRGQPSVRNSLRLNNFGLPTITDITALGAEGIVSQSSHISELRTAARGPVLFDVIPAPLAEGELGSAKATPAHLYATAIAQLRQHYDLIVVDTQIAESHLTDDIWSEVIIPLMRGGAWGVGIFDESDDGLDLLVDVSRRLVQLGVPNSRQLILGNQWEKFSEHDGQIVAQTFAGLGTFIGTADVDSYFHNRKIAGFIPTDAPAVAPLVKAVLLQITGRNDFQAVTDAGRGRRRLFGRREKRGRR